MQLDTYLTFNGQCEEAFNFYQQCLGGKLEVRMVNCSRAATEGSGT
jgi:PhnB protein